ncbi:MAG TPA: beta-ketoacyl-[acyl-carrier-protein] synthase family protein [Pirellulales bacterium]|jgi:3-oxoacyl-[acyl-carrier-protein] synthase II|nr:beta-ketoacyl-[acyl-carrier-protein] synthase family protein [Pirellulales bacterium]
MVTSAAGRRVVITGLGLISPLGFTKEMLWEALYAGRSGVGPLKLLPAASLPTSIAAEIPEFTGDIDNFGELEKDQKKAIRKGLKIMCREIQMGLASGQRAIADAGLKTGAFDPERAGAVFGTDYMLTLPEDFTAGINKCRDEAGNFDYDRWPTEGMPELNPLWLLKYLPNMPASHLAIYNDLRGPNNSITHREAAANLAVGEAFRIIARGNADIMVAGATGTRVHPMKTVHAAQTEQLADNPQDPSKASRPFDLDRSGMVLGEGAGAIVLEELSTAEARGATIYGEVIGQASSQVTDRNFVARRDEAFVNVLRGLLRDADATIADVGHIHAHGLSTSSCDAEEAKAIQEVFGDRTKKIPVVAAKSHFGNLGAGSGMVELIASTLALREKHLFPVLNYETPDPDCAVHVVREAGTPAGKTFVNLSVTPQGQASGVMVRLFE